MNPPLKRPDDLPTKTIKLKSGCETAYITLSQPESEYKEIYGLIGKTGGCPAALMSALTRIITVAMNYGVPKEILIKQLSGIRCPNDSEFVPSCPNVVVEALRRM